MEQWGRTLATLGIAAGGPLTIAAGAAVVATTPRGVPPLLVVAFAVAGLVTTVSVLVYLALDARDRRDR